MNQQHSKNQTTFFSWNKFYQLFGKKIGTCVGIFLERVLRIRYINKIYSPHKHVACAYEFNTEMVKQFDLQFNDISLSSSKIPTTGSLIVIANHPFGACEALLLLNWLSRTRKDVKFLANFLLAEITPLDKVIIQVDPFTNQSSAKNISGLREAIKWLQQEHALIIFPAGEVSRFTFKKMKVSDGAWSPQIARLAQITQTTILPVFIHGHNSFLFQLLSLIHKVFGLLLLPREFLKRSGKVTSISVGDLIASETLLKFDSWDEKVRYLRDCVDSLAGKK